MTEIKQGKKIKTSIFLSLINKKRLIDDFFKMLSIKSPSKNEYEMAKYVKSRLESLGLEVEIDSAGQMIGGNSGNIIAVLEANGKERKTAFFLGAHLDTVPADFDIIPQIKNGKITNSCKNCILGGDDKAAVAAILEALEVIKENNIKTGRIYFIFTVAEEIAILGAKKLDLKKIKAKYGIVLDGEGDIGTIYNQAPFQNTFQITITGRAAHAGVEPEKGINSIKVAAEAISKLKLGRIDRETTCNVGIINGGAAINIIPERTYLKAEARSLNSGKLEKITKKIKEAFDQSAKKWGARIKIIIEREYDGFDVSGQEFPVRHAMKAMENMGIKPKIISTGGGSDVNIFNARGKKSVTLSSALERVHTSKEFVKVKELEKMSALVLELCTVKEIKK